MGNKMLIMKGFTHFTDKLLEMELVIYESSGVFMIIRNMHAAQLSY